MTQSAFPRFAVALAASLSFVGPALAEGQPVAPPVQAQPASLNLVNDTGAAKRIDLAGKLRMLSQRVPAALCAFEAGFAPDTAQPLLDSAITEFDAILVALRHGNDARGVFGAEQNRKTIVAIERVLEIWGPMRDYAKQAEAVGVLPVDVASLQERSHELLERAKDLVTVVTGQYANPAELVQAYALTIDIAGRQRMLAQRMSKDACLLGSGHMGIGLTQDLRQTMEIYDASINALATGAPEAGVIAPPTEAISVGMQSLLGDWKTLAAKLAKLREGDALDQDQRAALFDGLNHLTAEMNTQVGAYGVASKTGL